MKIGQEVWVVHEYGSWEPYYYNQRYWSANHYGTKDAHVISFDEETVVVWVNDDATDKPLFLPRADVFEMREDADKAAQAKNLTEFGHIDGKWAAKRR